MGVGVQIMKDLIICVKGLGQTEEPWGSSAVTRSNLQSSMASFLPPLFHSPHLTHYIVGSTFISCPPSDYFLPLLQPPPQSKPSSSLPTWSQFLPNGSPCFYSCLPAVYYPSNSQRDPVQQIMSLLCSNPPVAHILLKTKIFKMAY